ncbi:conserved hypothetical protein [Theileria equi strain WA]|uniref:Uncharacterized protein n=1 Tax=Theileria equi strain WA TaxID=1537102 RepID=L1LC17_THEEQ|nr:conserved hypothetical protein [Theileria equi strain WA]EKX72992.1 conserved hypothetical protein [Theileria equi strain WA]|eukprot:XP_004832444.1 conserved hypothetical protein [Theileria equi strain WA]
MSKFDEKRFLSCFEQLTEFDAEKRKESINKILLDIETGDKATKNKEDEWRVGPLSTNREYKYKYALKDNILLQYTIDRLLKGIRSKRKNSRIGFTVALLSVLRVHIDNVDPGAVAKAILEYTNTKECVPSEVKDALCGRLFGIAILQRVGYFSLPQCVEYLSEICQSVWEVYDYKIYFQDAASILQFLIARDVYTATKDAEVSLSHVKDRISDLFDEANVDKTLKDEGVLSCPLMSLYALLHKYIYNGDSSLAVISQSPASQQNLPISLRYVSCIPRYHPVVPSFFHILIESADIQRVCISIDTLFESTVQNAFTAFRLYAVLLSKIGYKVIEHSRAYIQAIMKYNHASRDHPLKIIVSHTLHLLCGIFSKEASKQEYALQDHEIYGYIQAQMIDFKQMFDPEQHGRRVNMDIDDGSRISCIMHIGESCNFSMGSFSTFQKVIDTILRNSDVTKVYPYFKAEFCTVEASEAPTGESSNSKVSWMFAVLQLCVASHGDPALRLKMLGDFAKLCLNCTADLLPARTNSVITQLARILETCFKTKSFKTEETVHNVTSIYLEVGKATDKTGELIFDRLYNMSVKMDMTNLRLCVLSLALLLKMRHLKSQQNEVIEEFAEALCEAVQDLGDVRLQSATLSAIITDDHSPDFGLFHTIAKEIWRQLSGTLSLDVQKILVKNAVLYDIDEDEDDDTSEESESEDSESEKDQEESEDDEKSDESEEEEEDDDEDEKDEEQEDEGEDSDIELKTLSSVVDELLTVESGYSKVRMERRRLMQELTPDSLRMKIRYLDLLQAHFEGKSHDVFSMKSMVRLLNSYVKSVVMQEKDLKKGMKEVLVSYSNKVAKLIKGGPKTSTESPSDELRQLIIDLQTNIIKTLQTTRKVLDVTLDTFIHLCRMEKAIFGDTLSSTSVIYMGLLSSVFTKKCKIGTRFFVTLSRRLPSVFEGIDLLKITSECRVDFVQSEVLQIAEKTLEYVSGDALKKHMETYNLDSEFSGVDVEAFSSPGKTTERFIHLLDILSTKASEESKNGKSNERGLSLQLIKSLARVAVLVVKRISTSKNPKLLGNLKEKIQNLTKAVESSDPKRRKLVQPFNAVIKEINKL